MTLVFLDTETTSLRHDRRAWEIGMIIRRGGHPDHEQSWFINSDDLDLGNADLISLHVGRYHKRHPDALDGAGRTYEEADALFDIEALTRGAIIVGAIPWFDTDVLGQRMRANGICPSWHYHLIDVETLAAGALKVPPPWRFDDLLKAYGLTYDQTDRHTALGDARMVRDLFDAIMANQGGTTA